MKKADYSKIAPCYDKGRYLTELNMDLALGFLTKYAKTTAGIHILDLGCGTGRFALPMAERLGCRVTGADNSPEMLDKAREKDTRHNVIWDIQDAHRLSYYDTSFDIVFISHLLHHCAEPGQVLVECRRVLKPGGLLLIRHCVIEEIREDPESIFFPEALSINETRIATIAQMIALLKEAGFVNINSEIFIQRSSENGQILYERMSTRNVSSLVMIPQQAFERGLKRLHEYVQKHPDDLWLLDDKMRITTGYRDNAS